MPNHKLTEFERRCLQKPTRETAAARKARRVARQAQRTAACHGRTSATSTESDKRKAEEKRAEARVIRNVRRKVWRRSNVCECCAASEAETAQAWPKAEHEMHEVVPRSATRGSEPEVRFSMQNCMRVCGPCHQQLTEHVIGIYLHNERLGVSGDFDVFSVADGHVIRAMRRAISSRPIRAEEL